VLNFLAAAIPNPQRQAPGELTQKVDLVLGIAAWAGTAAGVAGVLVTGSMMALSMKRGESSEHMSRLGMVLGGCVLVATAGPLIQFVFN
jgi:ribose/xylose/arabinose/galactoside ABC-type transport system permease subunit